MILVQFCILILCFVTVAEAEYNTSSAHCFEPSEESFINLYIVWPAYQVDGSDGYCFDAQDFSYQAGDSAWTCSGCLKYTCTARPCRDRDGSEFVLFWMLESVGTLCCQSCDGTVFPSNKVMSTRALGGECDIVEVTTCTAPDEGGLVEISYESNVCCSHEFGWLKLGKTLLDPDTCSTRTCIAGNPAYWSSEALYQGVTNCCVYEGEMVVDGATVALPGGEVGKCCLGQIGATTTTTTTTALSTTSTTTTTTTTTITTTTRTTRTTTNTTTTTTSTTTTTTITTPSTLTSTSTTTSTTAGTTNTVMQGHTLLRKIVVNTTFCSECWKGSLVIKVWGADDAVDIYACETDPIRVTNVGKSEHENDLGLYMKTRGCHWAPLDANVSQGFLTWVGEGDFQADQLCFEWLDSEKFPLDCDVFENRIINCKTNKEHPDLKCPID